MNLNIPTPHAFRTARPSIAVGAAVLALMTVLGTAPAPESQVRASVPTPDGGGVTFAEVFQEMRQPETSGEGRGVVAIASAPPEIPIVQGADTAPVQTVPVAPSVQTIQPSLVIRGGDTATAEMVAEVEGVGAAASAMIAEMQVAAPGNRQTVQVAAIDPVVFRPLTPEITASEMGVWQRIAAGDAAFTHDAGNRLAIPLGSTVQVVGQAGGALDAARTEQADVAVSEAPGLGGTVLGGVDLGQVVGAESAPGPEGAPLRIGALASNGIPPIADALISMETATALGLQGSPEVYVGVADGADAEALRQSLSELTGLEVELLTAPVTQTNTFGAFLVGAEARSFFEPFDYIDQGDGLITIESSWVQRNIASTTQIPLLNGTVTCHRQMLRQLYGAMSEVQAAGLGPLIDPSQYGGCWVARHIDFNPSKPISMHGWGLAVDMNVSTNQLGARPTLDARIVEIFDRWGFVWGGRWSRPDGMHFEIGAVIDVPVPDGFFR